MVKVLKDAFFLPSTTVPSTNREERLRILEEQVATLKEELLQEQEEMSKQSESDAAGIQIPNNHSQRDECSNKDTNDNDNNRNEGNSSDEHTTSQVSYSFSPVMIGT